MNTKLTKFITILLALMASMPIAQAQSELDAKAPTLQIGLDGFSFAKGSLDAQLIMEIVAEKQKEIKVKAIQNIFLTKVENAGGTIYSFVDNVVRELVFEPDQSVRTKKILENSVNLVFTGAFLNFYLSTLEPNTKERKDFARLAKTYNDSLNVDTLISKKLITIKDFSTKKRRNSFFKDQKAVDLISLLLDMCSKAIREDKKLKQLGLMQIAYSETYEHMNLYDKSLRNANKSTMNETLVYDSLASNLSKCTEYIGIVNYLVSEKTFRFNVIDIQKSLPDGFKVEQFNKLGVSLGSIQDSLKSLIAKLENLHNSSNLQISYLPNSLALIQKQDTALQYEITNLVKIYFYIDKAIKALKNKENPKVYADILYTIYSDFVPLLKEQSFRSIHYIEIVNDLNDFNEILYKNLLTKNEVLKKYEEKIPNFLQLVSKLYQFDRSATIAEYMKLLDEIGTYFPDDNIRNSLSTVINFVKDYTVIETNDKEKEVISFNVESFLFKLQSIKPYRLNRIQFMFTVGVNNAMFKSDLQLPDGSISRNLSFVGEKIGVKWKLYDWSFSRTRNPGETYKTSKWPGVNCAYFIKTSPPKEPIISNFHLLAYGTGLLYNLVNTKTEKEFTMPLIAAGAGLTFYNGLDFNVSWGVPIFSNKPISTTHGFWNIGFDIQFIEYYDRLMEKRKNNQTQKRLAEAKRN